MKVNNKIDFKKDIRFSILTVADKCGIAYDKEPISHGVFNAKCPFCEGSTKKMYLTTENITDKGTFNNVWRCNKCGEKGTALKLYARMKGLKEDLAFKELANDKVSENAEHIQKLIDTAKEKPQCLDTADIDRLNAVYNDFLDLLSLNSTSYKNLKERGLTDDFIKENRYKSIPSDYKVRYAITQKLIEKGHDLKGIAGFYIDEYGKWTFKRNDGYLIPIKDLKGRICSFQIRMDKKINNLRYTYFSSSRVETGSKALCCPHVSYGQNTDKVFITEGVLKGDIARFFSNDTFICVPGVNSAIDILIDYIKEINPIVAILCYDMDMYENEEVKKALLKLLNLLDKANIYYEIKLWDKQFKGIDDYYYELEKKKLK